MFYKIKSYYRAFGFQQTILKFFRFAVEKLHTDRVGIYTPTFKEKKYLIEKKQQVFIFSDKRYSEENGRTAAEFALIFNKIGCKVNYYYLGDSIFTVKKAPLSTYECIDLQQTEQLKISDSVVVLDVGNEEALRLRSKINNEKCVFIETSLPDSGPTVEFCVNALNRLNPEPKCLKRFFENISVVILNYNNKNVIFNCLDTLIRYSDRYGYEIIVVDNQSTDGSYEMMCEKYQNVKLYRNSKNGCSSGRNLGLANATKEYVIFLDSDQWIIHENWLDVYLQIFDDIENVGAIGWTGGWFNRKGFSFHTVYNFSYEYMPPKFFCRRDIGYLGTGGMMVKKALLDDIGGFDLNYDPTCYEDTDISLEIRHRGKELYYCPYLGVGHLPHQTTKSGSDAHEKLIKEKGNYFVSKWKNKNKNLLKYVK